MKRFLIACAGLLLLTANLPAGRAFAQSENLESALSYQERPRGKSEQDQKSISTTQHLSAIDFESLIIIDPNKDLLKSISSAERPVLSPLSGVDQARLDTLPALLRAARAYVDEAAQVVETVAAAEASGQALSPAQIVELQEEIRAQARLGLQVLQPVLALAQARANDLFPNDATAAQRMVGTLTEPILNDDEGNRVILNVPALAEFLSQHLQSAHQQIQSDAGAAERQGTARFRMRAWLYQTDKTPSAISIENYDNIENLEGPKRSRIGFRMTPREQERLAMGLALSTVASTFIEGVREKRTTLRSSLQELKQTAIAELQAVQDLPLTVLSDSALTVLQDAIAVALPAATPAQAQTLNDLNLFLGSFQTSLNTIRTGIEQLKATSDSPEALVQKALALPRTISQGINLAVGYAGEVQTNVVRLPTIETVLGNVETPEAASITSRLGTVLPQTRTLLDSLTANHLGPLSKVAQQLNGLFSREQVLHLGNAMDNIPDPRVFALKLDQVKPGTINLEATPADRNDQIQVKAELFTLNEAGQEEILETSTKIFQVNRFGFTSEITAHLVFVDRVQGDSAQFDPATSASWTMHYRPRRGPDASGFAKLWAALDPGLGLNVSALGFDDANFQIGLGIHGSLFDDLLSFGYGYNLQAERDREYYYLGIGIMEALNTVGGLVGGSAR